MVKLAVMVAAGFFGFESIEAFGQEKERNELKGPKAKNYKPWRDQARKGTLVVDLNGDLAKGPKAKNQKLWDRDTQKVEINTELHPISGPKGPKAKNQKLWRKD